MPSIRSTLILAAALISTGAISFLGAGTASANCGLLNAPGNCGVLNGGGPGSTGVGNNLLAPAGPNTGPNHGVLNGGSFNTGIGNNLLAPGGGNTGILNQGAFTGLVPGLNVLNLGAGNSGIANIGTLNTGIANIGTGHAGILGGVLGH